MYQAQNPITQDRSLRNPELTTCSSPGTAALESEWNTAKTQTSIPLLSVDCQAEGARHGLCSSPMYDPANLPVISMLERGNVKTLYPGPRRASA